VVKVRQDEPQQIWGGAGGIGRRALADLQQWVRAFSIWLALQKF